MKTSLVLDLPVIRQYAEVSGPYLTGHLAGFRLYTAMQPIYSLAHKRTVGYEALLRVKDRTGRQAGPDLLFDQDRSAGEMVLLDRLCRYLHVHNFGCLADDLNWLFLNVSSHTILNGPGFGSFFSEMLEFLNFPPHRVVVEVVEQAMADMARLTETIDYYKALGCLIAIDDFGAGHSNFDRIWTLQPDIVKLDRSFLVRADAREKIREMLPGIVSLLHQAGALVLMEGVETRNQALIAIDSDADLVQGFYWGKPFTRLADARKPFTGFDSLLSEYKTGSMVRENLFRSTVERVSAGFEKTVDLLKQGESLDRASAGLLSDDIVVRCYQIDTNGLQIGGTIVSDTPEIRGDDRFAPLEDASSADWFRRHYLKRAMLHPGQLQVSRPYLSITGAHYCVTLSMQISVSGTPRVVCCDLAA